MTSRTGRVSRRPSGTTAAAGQPPHRDVAAVQRELGELLTDAQFVTDPEALLRALATDRADDRPGLDELLGDLGVKSPDGLRALLRLVAASAGYAALSWSRGIPTSEGASFSEEDVLSASWARTQESPTPA